MFAGKATGKVLLMDRLHLLPNIALGWKGLPWKNTLPYWAYLSFMNKMKCSECDPICLFNTSSCLLVGSLCFSTLSMDVGVMTWLERKQNSRTREN
jgi:hypothetical protein